MKVPSEAELAEIGLTRRDFEKDQSVEIWPDNLRAVEIFMYDLGTQWRMGPCGPTGLDYSVLPFVFRARGVARSEWSDVWQDIKVMEGEALRTMQDDSK